ncbi:hypothetical protein DIU31_031935 [Mucilaginibacter rubeus]|uniref:Uncharacterized protein n=1 Tax=Mucilaginibacter rubeus TaxID=2027860 RepID=A0AAE6JNK6_9SPHI|nr:MULTISPECIES: hypothetical protein [Mucilaginibacter]QEM07892.1 hypothetical protein DIU31_031935 [Mucilaginibacter rubeus]QEM20344.1 hypothetical protein DIU38_031540 [Mucilaginibacter gossypii]QTE42936.1 hypothetical protein J3L19_29115 [Mucilaginibacter rubeus]QTE49537.1 hypothetical protein J3L21_29075 [Mucilaginibacter rubeus]QTE54633.1 hypothetical protein J3L23_20700 [Mucilaginibacter rubeus]
MRTFIYFIVTCFISTGIYFAALNSRHPEYGIAIAIGLWAWFLWCYDRRMRKAEEKRSRYRR